MRNITLTLYFTLAPDIFCMAVGDSVARICWKDPTNGSYVMKYEQRFHLDGQNTMTISIPVDGVRDETCSIVRGAKLNRNYTFTVRVFNGKEWSPESLQRHASVKGKGKIKWTTSCEHLSSGIFDQVRFKPACSATEAS